MSVANKIRALLRLNNKKNSELAAYLNMTPQSLTNKLNRDSFSAEDLIKIAEFLECELSFDTKDGIKISLDATDLR